MRAPLKAGVCAAALALTAPAGAQQPQLSENEVRIGVLNDRSGVFSDLTGAGSVLAAQMAIDEFTAAAKPGFSIKLLSADHQNKPDVASTVTRDWSRRFYEKQKRMPTMAQAGTYSAVLHYLKAVAATGTDEPMKSLRPSARRRSRTCSPAAASSGRTAAWSTICTSSRSRSRRSRRRLGTITTFARSSRATRPISRSPRASART